MGIFASLCSFFSGCGAALDNDATEFDWFATESAPRHYPMEILNGTFFYKGRNDGLYIPSGGTLHAGWGEGISSHVTGPKLKPLPDRVEVKFYSMAENQFYHGAFDLPYERILAGFRECRDKNSRPCYSSVMVGVAPGGVVSVWLNGSQATEIFFGQAQKVVKKPSEAFGVPLDSQAKENDYRRKNLESALEPEELASLEKDGVPFGRWERYRKRYKWMPVYGEAQIPTNKKEMVVYYLNGENGWMPIVLTEDQASIPRPLPRQLEFRASVKGQSSFYIVRFDEVELMDAFERLGADSEKVYLEFEPGVPRSTTRVQVRNAKESIELSKTVTEE